MGVTKQEALSRYGLRGDVTRLLDPRSVAVVGASEQPRSVGGRCYRNLLELGFPGPVFPINPSRDHIGGVPCYGSVSALPEVVDLAIVAIPAFGVVDAVRDAAESGVKACVVSSAGFSEIGHDGVDLQEQLRELSRSTGIRILGPNCLGFINLHLPSFATFSASLEGGYPDAGRVGFVGQSGAVGSHWLAAARERGLGLSNWITTGNEVDVDVSDAIVHLATDGRTEVIAGYIEGVRDGERFRMALEIARDSGKPVILLKVGSSDAGARAAASHTAALVGSDRVYDAVFRRYGVIRARTIAELTDLAQAAASGMRPEGPRVGVLTISGGAGVLMADQCSVEQLELPPRPAHIQTEMAAMCPTATVTNPVDTTGAGVSSDGLLANFLETMLEEGGYDTILIFLAHVGLTASLTHRLVGQLKERAAGHPGTCVVISTLTSRDNRRYIEDAGFSVIEDPTAAVSAVRSLMRRDEETFTTTTFGALRQLPPPPLGNLSEAEAKRLLRSAGVPVLDERVAYSEGEVVDALATAGGDVVLKIASSRIPHKTDIGGVVLGVGDELTARRSFRELAERADAAVPGAGSEGVLVAPMIAGGVEVIVSARTDPLFGPFVVFGEGGTDVAGDDLALELAPLSRESALQMIRRTRISRKIVGGRGVPPKDLEGVIDVLMTLSALSSHWQSIAPDIEINPLLVRETAEGGVVALDAMVAHEATTDQAARTGTR